MLIIISSVRPSLQPRLSVLAAARNFVGKLRLMIMFNELYNKYIAAAAATEAAPAPATAHGTWTPKIAGTLRKVPEFMSLSLSLFSSCLSPPSELCLPLLHLTATLIQLGAAVIYEKPHQRAAHSSGPSA